MTLPVLQMLGTRCVTVYIVQCDCSLTQARYNVEPFFFASSANWIPSRYQEDPKALEDREWMRPCALLSHLIILLDITVVLPFIRTLKNQQPISRTRALSDQPFTLVESQSQVVVEKPLPYTGT